MKGLVGSGAGSTQAQRFSPAFFTVEVGAAWPLAHFVDCVASVDACLGTLSSTMCVFLCRLPGRPVCPVFFDVL